MTDFFLNKTQTIANSPKKSRSYDYFGEEVAREEKNIIKDMTGLIDPRKLKKREEEKNQEQTNENQSESS